MATLPELLSQKLVLFELQIFTNDEIPVISEQQQQFLMYHKYVHPNILM